MNGKASVLRQPPVGLRPQLYNLARGSAHERFLRRCDGQQSHHWRGGVRRRARLRSVWGTPNGTNHIAGLLQTRAFGANVLNGGFETGSFYDWTLVGDTQFGNNIFNAASPDPHFDHSGNYGVILSETGFLATLSQSVATTPGQGARFLLARQSLRRDANQFEFSWNGTVLFNQTDMWELSRGPNFQYIQFASLSSTVIRVRPE